MDRLRIVSVDDDDASLAFIQAQFKSMGLKAVLFNDPIAALEYFMREDVDLVLTDQSMTGMDGLELLKHFRRLHGDVPVVMITAHNDDEALRLEALEAGATDFLTKPLNSYEFRARLNNLLRLRLAQIVINDRARWLESEVKKATAEILAREMETLQIIGSLAEFKDTETGFHVARVAHYARMVARDFGLDEEQQDLVFHAAPLHDIGKIGIPDAILLKPGKLTDEEWDIMRKHTVAGYEILIESKSKFLRAGAEVALCHHEKFDGSGYPKGLVGTNIPLAGRIVMLADIFDALTSRRPYKEPWPFEQALAYIKEQSGVFFDPDLANVFLNNEKEVREIFNTYQD